MVRNTLGMFCVLTCYVVSMRSMDPVIDFESAMIERHQDETVISFKSSNNRIFDPTTIDGKCAWTIAASYNVAQKTYAGMQWDNTRPAGDQRVELSQAESERYFNQMKPLWEKWHTQWVKDCSRFER